MKIIKIDGIKPEIEKIEIARQAMKQGSTVVYPTDTVYGIGVNIFDEKAILKVYSMKKRSTDKPLSICLSSINEIAMVAKIDVKIMDIIKKILPGPYTIILNKNDKIPCILTAGSEKIGIRIPDNDICQGLSKNFPITSTSANISGQTVPESPDEIVKYLGSSVDVMLDAGVCEHGVHSTVIDMTVYPPEVIRHGAGDAAWEKIKDSLAVN